METRTVSMDGITARVHVGGAGDPLVLVHGGRAGAVAHRSAGWDTLAAHHRVVAPELPGIGDPGQPGLHTLGAYVEWLDRVLEPLDVRRAVCIGNSLGASLVGALAARHPERARAVVLVDGPPMPPAPRWMLAVGGTRIGRALVRSMTKRRAYRDGALAQGLADPARAPEELRATVISPPPARLETLLDVIIEGGSSGTPDVPGLVVWGDRDRLPGTAPRAGRRLAPDIGARFELIPDAGRLSPARAARSLRAHSSRSPLIRVVATARDPDPCARAGDPGEGHRRARALRATDGARATRPQNGSRA